MSIVALARAGRSDRLRALLEGCSSSSGGGGGGSCAADARRRDAPLAAADEPASAHRGANSADWLGRTALHRAARYGHVDVCRVLLAWGARVDVVDVHGQSALHVAAQHGQYDVLALLLDWNAPGLQPADAAAADGNDNNSNATFTTSNNIHQRRLLSAILPDTRFGQTPLQHLQDHRPNPTQHALRQRLVALEIGILAAAPPPAPLRFFRLRQYCRRLPTSPAAGGGGGRVKAPPPVDYSAADHHRFNKQGFHIFSHFISPALLVRARACVARLYGQTSHKRKHCDDKDDNGDDDAAASALSTAKRNVVVGIHPQADRLRLYNLHQCGRVGKSPEFDWIYALALHPRVLRVVARHCGPSFYFYVSHFICKPPRSAYSVPWHQDYRTKGDRIRTCSIWIALDDIDEDNGCVCVIPGAHRHGARQVRDDGHTDFGSVICESELMSKDASSSSASASPSSDSASASSPAVVFPLTMRAGQASILHPLMPHMSPCNSSDRWRRALVLRYAEAGLHARLGPGEAACRAAPAVFKDGSWFTDPHTGELFEGVSIKITV